MPDYKARDRQTTLPLPDLQEQVDPTELQQIGANLNLEEVDRHSLYGPALPHQRAGSSIEDTGKLDPEIDELSRQLEFAHRLNLMYIHIAQSLRSTLEYLELKKRLQWIFTTGLSQAASTTATSGKEAAGSAYGSLRVFLHEQYDKHSEGGTKSLPKIMLSSIMNKFLGGDNASPLDKSLNAEQTRSGALKSTAWDAGKSLVGSFFALQAIAMITISIPVVQQVILAATMYQVLSGAYSAVVTSATYAMGAALHGNQYRADVKSLVEVAPQSLHVTRPGLMLQGAQSKDGPGDISRAGEDKSR